MNSLLKKAFLASTLVLLGGNTVSQAFLGYTKQESLPFQTNVSRNTIAIVDAVPDREYFPAFHDVKLVFDSSIFLYKFDNAELIDRLYVSTGCPTNFGAGDLGSVVGYRVAPYEQKAARIRVLKKLPLLNSLAEREIRKLESIARIRREEIISELNAYLMKDNVSNCLQAASRFNVDLVIFDEASFWFKRAIQENYSLKRFNSRGLWYLDLST